MLTRDQMIESYMVFGGAPFYLELLNPHAGLVQNIDALCFERRGELIGEFDELYRSLFKHADRHISVMRALGAKTCGLTLSEVGESAGIAKGGTLVCTLEDLEVSGFVRRYVPFGRKSRGAIFQLVDPFSLFHLRLMEEKPCEQFWQKNYRKPLLNTWRSYAFELVCLLRERLVCLLRERQICDALGIGSIYSDVSS